MSRKRWHRAAAGHPEAGACRRKVRYRDKQHALATLRFTSRIESTVTPVRVYECPACNGWHLTSKPE